MPLETSRKPLKAIGLYDLVEQVAEGGMGTVYRARHRETGDMVAVKVMTTNMTGNPILLKRFEQEFHAARRLDHPNLVRALDFGQEGGVPYLVMEFVEGESLGQKIERDGRMNETEAIRLVAQVAQGLHRAHKMGMIHRDIKPDNVMVTPPRAWPNSPIWRQGEGDRHRFEPERDRAAGSEPALHGSRAVSQRQERRPALRYLWPGHTLYMMVTGELPFRSSGPLDAWMKKMHNDLLPPRKVVPSLSERIDWAIRRAMSADPEQRPTSCREFVEDLTGRSTRKLPPAGDANASSELWYLVYKDEEGVTHTVKGSPAAIRRSLKEGLLGDASNVRASRAKTGPFENLRSYPEFRDMVVTPAVLTVPKGHGTPVNTGDNATLPHPISSTSSRPSDPTGRVTPSPVLGDPLPDDDGEIPRIDLDNPENPHNVEWLKWALLILVAVLTAVIAFFLLPTLEK